MSYWDWIDGSVGGDGEKIAGAVLEGQAIALLNDMAAAEASAKPTGPNAALLKNYQARIYTVKVSAGIWKDHGEGAAPLAQLNAEFNTVQAQWIALKPALLAGKHAPPPAPAPTPKPAPGAAAPAPPPAPLAPSPPPDDKGGAGRTLLYGAGGLAVVLAVAKALGKL